MLGASGYTGAEVVRLCALHPNIKVTVLTGDKQAGKVGQQIVAYTSHSMRHLWVQAHLVPSGACCKRVGAWR